MIRVENIEVWGFDHAIRGMRNPLNSWDKSDSCYCFPATSCGDCKVDYNKERCLYASKLGTFAIEDHPYVIGNNDLDLMRRLYKAGPEHRKYLRQIFVSMDITAPLYWDSEMDTYKIGVTRNSCSFMHRGVSKPFEITDFSIHNEKVYEVFEPVKKKVYPLIYLYETDEYKTFEGENGRVYRVYRNGRIFGEKFEYTDTMGRHRTFELKELKPSATNDGYFELNIGGRLGRRWMLHRLVATLWLDNPEGCDTVNHIDGNKGNNCVENLEWCSRSDNIKKGFESGLYDNFRTMSVKYKSWKKGHTIVEPNISFNIYYDHKKEHLTCKQLAEKYDITVKQANNIISTPKTENEELFQLCYHWENIINVLNSLREEYLETKDPQAFQQIRCLLPCGYNQRYTLTMSYENVVNIIKQRTGHKLDEWNEFVKILRDLPYVTAIMGE